MAPAPFVMFLGSDRTSLTVNGNVEFSGGSKSTTSLIFSYAIS